MKVKNMKNTSGNIVKNQFIITDGSKVVFQSYESTICIIDNEKETITFGSDYDYSNTTMKFLKLFLVDNFYGESFGIAVVRKMIKKGEYNKFKVKLDLSL